MLKEMDVCIPNKYYKKYATVYSDTEAEPKACIFYFHGGGLLYGLRKDLPALHQKMLTKAGYYIIAFDYPLAPAAKLDLILEDACDSVNHYLENPEIYTGKKLPFFLWGRSAGAYLCLLIGSNTKLKEYPLGILSYYGYGFLCDNWFNSPNGYYCSLPPISDSIVSDLSPVIHATGDLNTHYGIYVYARQKGIWNQLIYTGREKLFYLKYTLRTCLKIPCPIFCAHSINDTDVPYSEFLELCSRYQTKRFVTTYKMHDFDRDENAPVTRELLRATLEFVEETLNNINKIYERRILDE